MNRGFTVASQLTGARPLMTKDMSLTFHTNEIPDVEKVKIIEHLGDSGWLLFAENALQESDIPKHDSEIEGKTPSQRLRGVLFLCWQAAGKQGEFESFYRTEYEKIISHFKNKL